jgi:hypothetical protein
MLQTYKAILHGSSLEWLTERPEASAVEVHVTLLQEPKISDGAAMAAALQGFADLEQPSSFGDAATWQHEVRTDRTLPNREA